MKMSKDQVFGQTTTVKTAPPAPPFFSATMSRDAPIGALISILIGFSLMIVNFILDQQGIWPMIDLNQWMVSAISDIDPEIGGYIGGLITMPVTNDTATPLFNLQFIYSAFLSFPANLSWLIGGMIVGAIRVGRGRDDGDLKGGWDTFWYGVLAIEIPFMVFSIIFLITSAIPTIATLIPLEFSGSVLLFFLLFFITPMFWMGLLMALIGSAIGSKIAKR